MRINYKKSAINELEEINKRIDWGRYIIEQNDDGSTSSVFAVNDTGSKLIVLWDLNDKDLYLSLHGIYMSTIAYEMLTAKVILNGGIARCDL